MSAVHSNILSTNCFILGEGKTKGKGKSGRVNMNDALLRSVQDEMFRAWSTRQVAERAGKSATRRAIEHHTRFSLCRRRETSPVQDAHQLELLRLGCLRL